MKKSILKQTPLIVILFVFFSFLTVFAKDNITIGILTFAVHSDKALGQFENCFSSIFS